MSNVVQCNVMHICNVHSYTQIFVSRPQTNVIMSIFSRKDKETVFLFTLTVLVFFLFAEKKQSDFVSWSKKKSEQKPKNFGIAIRTIWACVPFKEPKCFFLLDTFFGYMRFCFCSDRISFRFVDHPIHKICWLLMLNKQHLFWTEPQSIPLLKEMF